MLSSEWLVQGVRLAKWPGKDKVFKRETVEGKRAYLLPGRPAHAHEVHEEEANDAV